MTESSPFARAVRDAHEGDLDAPLVARDGAQTNEHPIEAYYFDSPEQDVIEWLASWLDGPLADLGAGAGRHTLSFQERFETVAVERDHALVETMRARGVETAVEADMFSLQATFDRDRFRSALVWGTQLGLARSMVGVRRFLDELATVTRPNATAIVDSYDPEREATAELLGYRSDPTPELGFRVLTFEYGSDVGRPLLFRLFAPDALASVAEDAGWTVEDVRYDGSTEPHYAAALVKHR